MHPYVKETCEIVEANADYRRSFCEPLLMTAENRSDLDRLKENMGKPTKRQRSRFEGLSPPTVRGMTVGRPLMAPSHLTSRSGRPLRIFRRSFRRNKVLILSHQAMMLGPALGGTAANVVLRYVQ